MKAITRRVFETICCICQRKKVDNGWERAVVHPLADLSHGYCPECYSQLMIDYGLASAYDRPLGRPRGKRSVEAEARTTEF